MKKEFERQILESEANLKSFIYRSCGDYDLTQDLFQNLFIRVHEKLEEGKYKEDTNFIGWVSTIARNMLLDKYRYDQRYTLVREDTFNTSEDGNVAEYMWDKVYNLEDSVKTDQLFIDEYEEQVNEQKRIKINSSKSHLSSIQYLVLTLRANDFSFKEISAITGSNINTSLGQMRYSKLGFTEQFNETRVREKRRRRFREGRDGQFDYEDLLLKLPPYQYFVVKMKAGRRFEDIAKLEGVPTSTVYYRFLWAKKNLKKMAKSEEDYKKIIEYIDSLNTNTGGKNWHKDYIKEKDHA